MAPGITSIIGSLEVTAGTTSTAGFVGAWLGLLGVIGSIFKQKCVLPNWLISDRLQFQPRLFHRQEDA